MTQPIKMYIVTGILMFVCCMNLNHAMRKDGNVRSKRDDHVAILRSESFYHTQQLFERFGDKETIQFDDLKTIVVKMGLGEMYHDHGDHNGHDHGDHDGHDHGDHDGHDHGDHDGHDHGDHSHDGHDHHHSDHDGHNHGDHDDHDRDHHGHRHRRQVANNTSQCSSMDDLLSDFSLNGLEYLTLTEFLYLCPALINSLMSGACETGHDHSHDHLHDHGEEKDEGRNMGLAWFYLMLSVTVISLCAVWGILCIPKRSRSVYEQVIQFLMALGAGSMAGDALLHLLPHALMPPHDHSHGHGGHDHGGHDHGSHGDHDEEHGDHADEHMDALMKGLVALIGLYGFFALERAFAILLSRSDSKRDGNSVAKIHMNHSHSEPLEDVKFISNSASNNTAITELSPTLSEGNGKSHHWPHMITEQEVNGEIVNDGDSVPSSEGFCPKLTPLALMIVLGDMFHNLCDGLAMGAAYSASTTVGISTSIAVFCHEFPHEIGDFAILMKSGLSKKWAVILNFVSALTCYLGAVIGMFVGSNVGQAPMWIFAGVAGMFLYIALVDLIPEMTHIYMMPGKRWGVFLGLHAAGLFTGSLFMFILGMYEHDIQTALN